MERISVAIVDEQVLFRQALGMLIQSIDSLSLVAETNNGEGLLHQIRLTGISPSLAVIEIKMDGMSGLELIKNLQTNFPQTRVIVLSMYYDQKLISAMMDAGACSYLIKSCNKEELITAMISVYKTGIYMNNYLLDAMQASLPFKNQRVKSTKGISINLTKREMEILKLICQELNNTQIADRLSLSTRTIEGHRNNLLLKIGCRNTAGLVLFAIKNRIVNIMQN